MRTSDRILLVLLAAVCLAAAVVNVAAEFAVFGTVPLSRTLLVYLGHTPALIGSFFITLLLVVVGLAFIVIVANSSKYVRTVRSDTVVMCDNNGGKVSVTFEALRAIAKKKCLSCRFVNDCAVDVFKSKKGVDFMIRVKPKADVALCDATKQLQDELRETVEQQTGLTVGNVNVVVLPYVNK